MSGCVPLNDLACCMEAGLEFYLNVAFPVLLPVRGASAATNAPRTTKRRIAISTKFQRRNLAAVPGAGEAKLHSRGPYSLLCIFSSPLYGPDFTYPPRLATRLPASRSKPTAPSG